MVLGDGYRTLCHVERDAYAATVLVARMDDSSLDRAPIWDDLTTFDATAWRGAVDIVTAGFPCQPWSVAGKRRGADDERWLWPDIARIVRDCGAPLVFLENVPGLYRNGLRVVLSDLAALRFDAEWTCVSASDIGAPHRRERVFILAHRSDDGREQLRASHDADGRDEPRDEPDGCDPAVEHSQRTERRADAEPGDCRKSRQHGEREAPGRARGRGQKLEHAHPGGLEGRGHPRTQRFPFPPGPSDAEGWRRWIAAGGPEPGLRRGPDGIPARVDRLRALGNAVVPAQTAEAFRQLVGRAVKGEA